MAGYRGNEICDRLPVETRTRAAEIGVLRGETSDILLARRPLLTLYMVDRWKVADPKGSWFRGSKGSLVKQPQPFWDKAKCEALARVQFAGQRAIILHGDSAEVAGRVRDDSLDLVFIDGNHTYEGVTRDIGAWYSKVKFGGWFGGHDYEHSSNAAREHGVNEAVQEFVGARGLLTNLQFGEDSVWFIHKPKGIGYD